MNTPAALRAPPKAALAVRQAGPAVPWVGPLHAEEQEVHKPIGEKYDAYAQSVP